MKIVFLDEYSLGGADTAPIKALGEYVGYEITEGSAQIIERAADAQVIICNKTPLSGETLASLPSLRLICVAATGMNNIDLDAAAALGIEVRNAAGYSTYSVAEATLGSALALLRQTTYYDRFVKSGDYSRSGRLFNFDRPIGSLRGKRWGIIGLGAIGREVARLASAFGCEVRYYSTSGVARDEAWERCETLSELLSGSDIVSIHSPLNSSTAGLIGREELLLMGQKSLLVNVARGGIVDEEALCGVLNEGLLRGVATDVFSQEPLPIDSPLLRVQEPDKLLLSPHNAWSSDSAISRLIECISDNIRTKQ